MPTVTNATIRAAGLGDVEHILAQYRQAIKELPAWYRLGKPKPEDGRIGFATWKHYRKEDPLLESGLIGPVQILTSVVRNI